jgi:uncharacterized protein
VIGLLCLGSGAGAKTKSYSPFPSPDIGYVTDLAGILTQDQKQQLNGWLLQTEKRNDVKIFVVTIHSMKDYPGTPNRDIEAFAPALFDAYGIGHDPKNNGVLLLVAVQDRQAKIVLGAGYSRARDKDSDRIMEQTIVPCFRQGHYNQGVVRGVRALARKFGGVTFMPGWLPWTLIGLILALIPVAVSLFRNGKRGWGWVVVGLIVVLVLILIWLARRVLETSASRGGYASGGRGDAGGNQPGGLGGFGGGFSGGGGATGSW